MLHKQPGRMRSVLPDERDRWPAVALDDLREPFRVFFIDISYFRTNFIGGCLLDTEIRRRFIAETSLPFLHQRNDGAASFLVLPCAFEKLEPERRLEHLLNLLCLGRGTDDHARR